MGLLDGRVVLVTGGGRGIGAAVCRVAARHGATVAVNYCRSAEAAAAVAAGIEAAGGSAGAFPADVRDGESTARMVAAVVERFGRLDGVVNNAIAGRQHGAFEEATDEDFEQAFAFGCGAVVNMVRAVRPVMREQGGGRIVNVVTEIWNLCPARWSVYMAGKGAMAGLSRTLSQELGPENITVNMVAPGWMADEKVDLASEASRSFAASLPLRRHGSADEIGNACVFFLSDLAGYVTGAYLPVTGGRVTQAGV